MLVGIAVALALARGGDLRGDWERKPSLIIPSYEKCVIERPPGSCSLTYLR